MTKNRIKVALIGGSGLDDPQILKKSKTRAVSTPYGEPSDKLITGQIGKTEIVVLARHGRNHSLMPTKVPFRANLWALKKLGVTHIIATTACGSLKAKIKPRQLVFLDQFIDFTKHRPLTFHEDKVVHTAMADPFCTRLNKLLAASAQKLKISHHRQGAMLTIEGPRFSTRAESRLFRRLGADVINMSTVPEVILARELGICYASIAMATDYDSWHKTEKPVTWDTILSVMKDNSETVKKLILETIPKINFTSCSCGAAEENSP